MRYYRNRLDDEKVCARCISDSKQANLEKQILLQCRQQNILQPIDYYKSEGLHFLILPK